MPVFQNQVGINLTESKLQLVEISYKEDSFFLENVDQSVFKEPLTYELSEAALISILQESFNKIVARKKINSTSFSFSLPNNFFKIFEIPFDSTLTKKDLLEHFRWEISVLYPGCQGDNFYLQHIEVNKSGVRLDNRAIVFALDKKIVSAIYKFCKANSFELKFVDNAHLASNVFVNLGRHSHDLFLTLLIDQNFSSIAALEGDYPFYFKTIDSTGENFFAGLKKALNQLKNFNIEPASVARAFINGQSLTGDFIARISGALGMQIVKTNPFERLKATPEMKNNVLFNAHFNSFTAAVGVAIRIF